MEYIDLFNTYAEYDAALQSGDWKIPHVSLIRDNDELVWDTENMFPLYLTSKEGPESQNKTVDPSRKTLNLVSFILANGHYDGIASWDPNDDLDVNQFVYIDDVKISIRNFFGGVDGENWTCIVGYAPRQYEALYIYRNGQINCDYDG